MRNRDHSNFARVEAGRAILAEEAGPGVITRIWLTIGGHGDPTIGNQARLHLWIDGRELALGDPEPGVSLGELTSGRLPGLPAPWVLGRTEASGGFVISVPIAYASSVRVAVDAMPELWTYYQIDGRALPAAVRVRSFTERPPPEHDAALAVASALWERHEHPGEDRIDSFPVPLAPGSSIEHVISGPAVVTTIAIASTPAQRRDLHVTIEVDGQTAAAAPLAWLTGSAAPAEPFRSGFAESSPTHASLYAPIPIEVEGRVRVRNAGLEQTDVGVRIRVLAVESIDEDVGRFQAICNTTRVDTPHSICEQESTAEHPNAIVGGIALGPGQYAGQTVVLHTPEAWWWGLEGDHEVYIDGAPALLGTGTEDYFGGAFYFMEGPYASLTSGAPGWVRRDDQSAETSMYRWHIVDTIPFERELRFEYESYVDLARWDGCIFVYRFLSEAG